MTLPERSAPFRRQRRGAVWAPRCPLSSDHGKASEVRGAGMLVPSCVMNGHSAGSCVLLPGFHRGGLIRYFCI